METIHYKKEKTETTNCTFEIDDIFNCFLKSKYNYCNSATYPHFGQFRAKNGEIATIEFYIDSPEANISIRRDKSNNSPYHLNIQKFIEKQKGDVQIISCDEFLNKYNKLVNIENKEILTCMFCEQQKEDVQYRVDPYANELNNDDTTYPICNDCVHERAMDI